MIWRSDYDRAMPTGGRPLPGFASDLAFSVCSYLVLSTILGILTLALRWELEPYLGSFFAQVWGPMLALAYCVWQFCTLRRLRRAADDARPPT